jgi:AcrR family transcriptional regulator
MGKAEENKKQKQSRLLSTAFQLFTTKGIAQTSVSDIADSAGVGKGTFYLYFKDKYDIQAKLISHRADQIFTHALHTLEQRQQERLSLEDQIIVIVDDVLEQLQHDHPLLRFINKNLSWGVFRNAITTQSTDEETGCYPRLQRLIQAEGSDWEEPDLMLYTIIELTSSTCYNVILNGDPVPMEVYRTYLNRNIRSIIQNHRKEK